MLFTRLFRSFFTFQWSIFLIEILVLFIGIFMGIEASEWYQRRLENQEKIYYMDRLKEDMNATIAQASFGMHFMERQFDLEADILRQLRNCKLEEGKEDDFSTGLFLAGKFIPPAFVTETLDELRYSGKYTLIPVNIRKILQAFASEKLYDKQVLEFVYQRANPHLNYIETKIIYTIDKEQSLVSTLPFEKIDIQFDELCQDRRFHAAISSVQHLTLIEFRTNQALLKEYKETLKTIQEHIKKL